MQFNDLNKLRVFHLVCKTKSMRESSKLLGVTPPAISICMKNLEKELGIQLFYKNGRVIVPTRNSQKLDKTLVHFFHELDKTLLSLQQSKTSLSGNLHIGAPTGFGSFVLNRIIMDFQGKYPKVKFEIKLGPYERLISSLCKGDLDFLITGESIKLSECQSRVCHRKLEYSYEMILVGSKEIVAKIPMIGQSLYDFLVRTNHIALSGRKHRIFSWYRLNFKSAPKITIGLEVDSIFSAIQATKIGLGLCLLPSDIIANELKSGEFIKLGSSSLRTQHYVLLQSLDLVPSLLHKKFLTFLRFQQTN